MNFRRKELLRCSRPLLLVAGVLMAAACRATPRLAFQVYAVRQCCERDFEATLRAAKAFGYEGVETGRYYGRSGKELKALCARVGLKLVALQIYPDGLTEPQLLDTIRFAKDAGTDRINVSWFKGSFENPRDWQLLVNVVNHAAEVCRPEGISICYHNHDQEFLGRFDGKLIWDWLWERFSPSVGQELDAGWCVSAGEDPFAAQARHPHRNPMVHVMPSIADVSGLKPGEAGVGSSRDRVDWRRFLRKLSDDGTEWLVVKPTAFPDSLEDLKSSYQFIKANLGFGVVLGDWGGKNRNDELDAGTGLDRPALENALDRIERENKDQPFAVTRAKWMVAFLDHVRLGVRPDDVFVDWCADWMMLSDRRERRLRDFARSMPGIGHLTERSPRCTHGAYVATLDPSHVCPDWESLLSLGLKGLAARARDRLDTAKTADERVFLEGVTAVYEAMCRLCVRWAQAAERRGAASCAATLRALAERPPDTLREALQLMLVFDRCQEAEGEYVRSMGLFDRLYIGFYRRDLAAGRETRASAKALVKAVFDKIHLQAHPNGKNIALGGSDRSGVPVWNELTEIVFELHRELNRPNPKLTFRFGARTPREQMEKVSRCLAEGRTSVVLANEETLKDMFMRRGIEEDDTADAVLIGCYEPAVQGREVIASMAAWVNLAKPLEAVLNGGRDFEGHPVGPSCAIPKDAAAFEAEYLRQLDALVETALAKTVAFERRWTDLNPAPLMSGTFRDAIARARDAYGGSMKYNQSGVMCAGFATVVDSLAAVRWLTDETHRVSLAELAEILKTDWKGREALRTAVRRTPPKWGNNDDRADAFGQRVFAALASRINATRNGHGGTFQLGVWSIDHDLTLGRLTAATPDGRKSGEALSRNNMATAGCGREGPTALLLSNVKLDLAEAADGHIVDLIVPAAADGSQTGRVANLLATFSKLRGQCVHLNVFDEGVLRDAQTHPENYPDLQVRVCGWNVHWIDLSRAEQDMFIRSIECLK